MKRLIYISDLDISGDKLLYEGVMKKMMLEIKTFQGMDYNVSYVYRKDGSAYLLHNENEIFLTTLLGQYYKDQSTIFKALRKILVPDDFSVIYLRYAGCSLNMTRFLKYMKTNKNILTLAELPTFMKKWEPGTSLSGIVKFIIKKLIDNYMPKAIDYVVTFDSHKKLFGKPTIQIENFVDVDSIKVRDFKTVNNEIHLLAVAMATPSHGFDRVIKGLADYYSNNPTRKVIFHIVGGGSVINQWKSLAQQLGVNDYIKFEGIKYGNELDSLFNSCQIGVASLAIFRKKCDKASELKIREYLSRGIPFIYSAFEPEIGGLEYLQKVPHNESPIDINNLIEFIDSIDFVKASSILRSFAENKCICASQFSKLPI